MCLPELRMKNFHRLPGRRFFRVVSRPHKFEESGDETGARFLRSGGPAFCEEAKGGNMRRRQRRNACLAGLMVCFFMLLMADRYTGSLVHEWLGCVLCILVVRHVWKNRHWYVALRRGRYTLFRCMSTVLNLLLSVASIGTLVSAVPISGHVFAFLGVEGALVYRTVHVFCAHWMFLLSAVHAGLYVCRVMPELRLLSGLHVGERGMRLFCAFFACYGAYAFLERGLGRVLTMRSSFMFWGAQESMPLFFLDYGAMFFLWALASFLLFRMYGNISCRRRVRPGTVI